MNIKLTYIFFIMVSFLAGGYAYAIKANSVQLVSQTYRVECNNGKYLFFDYFLDSGLYMNGYGHKSKNRNDIATSSCVGARYD